MGSAAMTTTRTSHPVIQVSGFRKTYKSVVAVDDVPEQATNAEKKKHVSARMRRAKHRFNCPSRSAPSALRATTSIRGVV